MDYTSFSHGQIVSKLWLCDHIEQYLTNSKIAILGGWYNILGFLLLSRYQNKINHITSFDIDQSTKPIADKIVDAWLSKYASNITADVNTLDFQNFDIIINCSPEHMSSNDWFNNIPNNKLVCIQSSNITIKEHPWLVCNPNTSLNNLCKKYKLSKLFYNDELPIVYTDWGYKRYMIIGEK